MTDSFSAVADKAFAALPAELVDSARLAWVSIVPAIQDIEDERAHAWIATLPRVLALSEFVAQAGRRSPALIRELLESGELYRPASPGELCARAHAVAAGAADEAELKRALRRLRQREMVRLAWRDLSGRAELPEVLASLSDLADGCIDVATTWLLRQLTLSAGTPHAATGEPIGLIVLALGKLGGGELNFSSDVDLILAYPEDGEIERPAPLSHHEFFLRLAQALVRVLSEPTADGFVFRVDTRLRPFGNSGPLALSADAIEHYYQTHGREWERYALIKARVCAGDRVAGDELLKRLKPFVYRRYLDFGALDSIRDMKDMVAREARARV
jgi:[glutamine synthetase] adenylyltransferase / [glutamine synthetase]-adenylyl-L-tyrosine phosphorylase